MDVCKTDVQKIIKYLEMLQKSMTRCMASVICVVHGSSDQQIKKLEKKLFTFMKR